MEWTTIAAFVFVGLVWLIAVATKSGFWETFVPITILMIIFFTIWNAIFG
jgi:hypothetical protein